MRFFRSCLALLAVALLTPAPSLGAPVTPFEGTLGWSTFGPGRLGTSLAVGDFDGDQNLDLAAGDPTATGGGTVSIYRAPLIGGAMADQILLQEPTGRDLTAQFGATLLAIDFDGNGQDELVVGAPDRNGFGAVYLYSWTTIDGGSMQVEWSVQATAPSDSFGASLAKGDLDADSIIDLVVGDPDYDGGNGMVRVLDQTGVEVAIALGSGAERLGAAVGVAKLWGPLGLDTLVIGAPEGLDFGGSTAAGRLYLVPGPSGGSIDLLGSPDWIYHAQEAGQRLGSTIVGPMRLDSTEEEDLAITAPGAGADSGWIYALTGITGGPPSLFPALQETNPATPIGTSLASVPDWNGDGCDELVVGIGGGGGALRVANTASCHGNGGTLSIDPGSWELTFTTPGPDLGTAMVVAPGLMGHARGGLLVSAPGDLSQKLIFWPPMDPPIVGPRLYEKFPLDGVQIRVTPESTFPFGLKVTDDLGAGIEGVQVDWSLTGVDPNDASLAPQGATTNSQGYSAADLHVSPGAGSQAGTVTAAVDGQIFDWSFEIFDPASFGEIEIIAGPIEGPFHPGETHDFWVQVTSSTSTSEQLSGFPLEWTVRNGQSSNHTLPLTTYIADTGQSTNSISFGDQLGEVVVEVRAPLFPGLPMGTVTFNLEDENNTQHFLSTEQDEFEVASGASVHLELMVQANGGPASAVPVTWRVEGDAPAVIFSMTLEQTDFDGRAETTVQGGDSLGDYTIIAEVQNPDGPTNLAFHVRWVDSNELPSAYGCSGGSGEGRGLALFLVAFGLLGLGRRRRQRLLVLALAVGFGLPVLAQEKEDDLVRLAYLGVQSSNEARKLEIRAISEFAQSELGRLGVYSVLGIAEIQALLGLEQQKQLLGCVDESSACLTELGGSLGAGRLLSGNLTQIGRSVILNFSLLDVESARLVHRAGVRVTVGDDYEPVLDRIPALMRELAEGDAQVRGRLARSQVAAVTTTTTAKSEGTGTPAGVAPTATGPAAIAAAPAATPGLPAGHSFTVGLRADIDPISPGGFPGVQLTWGYQRFGAALSLLLRPWEVSSLGAPQRFVGGRLELRGFPLRTKDYALHLGGGVTALDEFFHLRFAGGGGIALGPVWLGLELAYERLLQDSNYFRSNVLLIGLSLGLSL